MLSSVEQVTKALSFKCLGLKWKMLMVILMNPDERRVAVLMEVS